MRVGLRPWEIVDVWEVMVDEILGGYEWTLYEYENEISVRDRIESALSNPAADEYSHWARLTYRVDVADMKLRNHLSQGPEIRDSGPWWRRRLPPYGGPEFIDDVKRIYGIVLSVV